MSSYVKEASFPRLERQGIVFGLAKVPLLLAGIAVVAVFIAALTSNGGAVLNTLLFFSVPLLVFAFGTWQTRPFSTLLFELVIWMIRKLLRQNRYKVRPERLIETNRFNLPGVANLRLSAFTTQFGEGTLLWDSQAATATAVIRCESRSFALASESDQASRIAGFSTLCAQATANPGVERVALHARTLPASMTAVGDHYNSVLDSRGPSRSEWANQEYEAVVDLLENNPRAVGAVRRDILVAVTISAKGAQSAIKNAGGGKEGMSFVMAQEVANLGTLLENSGARNVRWLSEREVAQEIRTAYDPDYVQDNERIDNGHMVPQATGPVVVVEEFDHMRTDSAFHQTFWISEWPRTKVPAGFLSPLISSGEYTHTVTQVFRPVDADVALKNIRDSKMALQSKAEMDGKLGRLANPEGIAQMQELLAREQEIIDGFSDIRFTGYISISAPTLAKLGEARSAMQRSIPHLNLRLLSGSQSAAFTCAVLPVGWGMK